MNRVRKAELKILIVFLYFSIFTVTSLIAFTIISQNITDFASELTFYFVCESQGIQPGRTCERGFNRIGAEVALMFAYIFLGFFPLVSLVYVINCQEIKKKFSKWFVGNGNGSGRSDFIRSTSTSKA